MASKSSKVRKTILIVDDNFYIRHMVRSRFESQSDFEVCGEAINGQDAIDRAKQLRPDLIILDFSMPVMDGITAASILSKVVPPIVILLFTMHAGTVVNAAANAAGVSAVIAKDQGLDELVIQAQILLRMPVIGRSQARGT